MRPAREKWGPVRLLDVAEGRWKPVFKNWLGARASEWRDGIELVAMDGFNAAAAEELLEAAYPLVRGVFL